MTLNRLFYIPSTERKDSTQNQGFRADVCHFTSLLSSPLLSTRLIESRKRSLSPCFAQFPVLRLIFISISFYLYLSAEAENTVALQCLFPRCSFQYSSPWRRFSPMGELGSLLLIRDLPKYVGSRKLEKGMCVCFHDFFAMV